MIPKVGQKIRVKPNDWRRSEYKLENSVFVVTTVFKKGDPDFQSLCSIPTDYYITGDLVSGNTICNAKKGIGFLGHEIELAEPLKPLLYRDLI